MGLLGTISGLRNVLWAKRSFPREENSFFPFGKHRSLRLNVSPPGVLLKIQEQLPTEVVGGGFPGPCPSHS